MRAAAFAEPGPPDVLRLLDRPEPQAGPGEVRVRVKAAGVQPFDAALRRGWVPPYAAVTLPQIPGNEFAGVIDQGDGQGTEVLGFSVFNSYAEYVVVPADHVTPKPAGVPWEVAGGFTAGWQTARLALSALRVQAGDTVLINAAAGSTGTAGVQLARLLGATVIGTASAANQDYVRSLGAIPVVYGHGLAERVRALAPQGVTAAIDGAGGDALTTSLELVEDPKRIITLVEHGRAEELGLATIQGRRSADALAELVALYAEGRTRWTVRRVYPLAEAAAAHREIETGHGRGKIVLAVDN
ncbi:NADP-dependent oxidoreductase [Dactylosporangium vinaceum]|uniref:NADP-dependent oxidoreductase n=1 Tax=Dactylosporangium vinaceum TaxID=53362 RepID=A0ABV5MHB3_9ACTN|nr:NADP-dependent oxidoreductase [Dactylosporangium vinaceum]UAB94849.1 NADP-dependent oxidoreductase [Dactylosporangium vinaceum]